MDARPLGVRWAPHTRQAIQQPLWALSLCAAKERAMRCLIGLAKVVMVGAIAGAMTGGAFAQEQTGEKEQVQKSKPVLAGPTVRENRIPGVEESFGGADRMAGMS